jgi:3-phenylpropionate/cinnamic acid dioxygenase small subunit
MSTTHVASDRALGRRIRVGEPAYNEVLDFLIEEATLLDTNRLDDWLACLADDIEYTMPVRRTTMRAQGPGFDPVMTHFDEDHAALEFRVTRLAHTDSGFADDPPSRTRRHVTNLRVHETPVDDEYEATSSLLLLRSRWDASELDLVSCAREDRLRRSGDSFLIARRRILVDQASLGTPNLAVFL